MKPIVVLALSFVTSLLWSVPAMPAPKFYRNKSNQYLGAHDGPDNTRPARLSAGIEVPSAPSNGTDVWNGVAWIPVMANRQVEDSQVKAFLIDCMGDNAVIPEHLYAASAIAACASDVNTRKAAWARMKQLTLNGLVSLQDRNASIAALEAKAETHGFAIK